MPRDPWKYFDGALYWIVVVLSSVLALMGFVTVIFRYVLQASLIWGDEFLRYLMIWLVFLGTALAARHRALMTVDVVIQALPPRAREYALAAVFAVCTLFLIAFGYVSVEFVQRSAGSVSTALRIPMEWMYLVFPVGLGLMAVNTLRAAVGHWQAGRRGGQGQDEEPEQRDSLLVIE